MNGDQLPEWAREMRDLFRSGSAAQFLLHGNVFDLVSTGAKMVTLPVFLDEIMFASYDVVLRYDRSRGVRATRGNTDWTNWLNNALGNERNPALLREQAALSTDPAILSRRIDEITATMTDTSQWLRDQQQVFGAMEDLLSEPPPVALGRARERQ